MRFHADGPAIPDQLLDDRDVGSVVFMCGAGVSIEAGLPSFQDLARNVAKELHVPPASEVGQVLQTYACDDTQRDGWRRPFLDEVFQMLYQQYGREQVKQVVWEKLKEPPKKEPKHGIIARLSASDDRNPRIVTTNFDRLFEVAINNPDTKVYEPRALPDLGNDLLPPGIVYLHGRLSDKKSDSHNYCLGSAELGQAYLAEGWATRFVRDLIRRHTVVFLGYQADDPPLRYLLEGLSRRDRLRSDRLFAFDWRQHEGTCDKWKRLGVRAIFYGGREHKALWDTLVSWAERADDPELWRKKIVRLSWNAPRTLAPHERGMVAHLVKSNLGAKLFAGGDPAPPAEWLCVFDASYRCARPVGTGISGVRQQFDPLQEYGLDDDSPPTPGSGGTYVPYNEDLITWRPGDDRVNRWQGLSRHRRLQHFPLSPRLSHLAQWLANWVHDPVLAWWVARQPALHPCLHQVLSNAVDCSPGLTDVARLGWMVLLEAFESRTRHRDDSDLHNLIMRIQRHGWQPGLVREFEFLTEPVFEAGPPRTLRDPEPPSGDWSVVTWQTVADIGISFPPFCIDWPAIPDDNLLSVYTALERNLLRSCARTREASRIGWKDSDMRPDKRNRDAYVCLFEDTRDRLALK